MKEEKNKIIAAAIVYEGKLFWSAKPARHCHVWSYIMGEYDRIGRPLVKLFQKDQGFIDSNKKFHNIRDAAKIAFAAGQITAKRMAGPPMLSEDLW